MPQAAGWAERLQAGRSPIEHEIAAMLADPALAISTSGTRLGRYQRKVDVARALKVAYGPDLGKPLSLEDVSEEAYLALALVFAEAAHGETGDSDLSRGRALAWVNSAFNCMDHVRSSAYADPLGRLSAGLHTLAAGLLP